MSETGQDPANPGGETPTTMTTGTGTVNLAPVTSTTTAADLPKGADGQPFDAERAQRTIEALRNEIKELKPKALAGQTAQQRLQEIEDAQKSDLEKAQAKAEALEARAMAAELKYCEALIRAAIEREAHAQGAVKAEVVYRLVDQAGIELDEAGTVKGADKAVERLLKDEPYLKAGGGETRGVPGTGKGNGQATHGDLVKTATEEMRRSGRYAV